MSFFCMPPRSRAGPGCGGRSSAGRGWTRTERERGSDPGPRSYPGTGPEVPRGRRNRPRVAPKTYDIVARGCSPAACATLSEPLFPASGPQEN